MFIIFLCSSCHTTTTFSESPLASPSSSKCSPPVILNVTEGNESDSTNVEAAFDWALKRQLAFCGEENLKKACRPVYNLNIRQFLSETVPGQHILNSYNRDKKFTRTMRNQLTHILISALMNRTR